MHTYTRTQKQTTTTTTTYSKGLDASTYRASLNRTDCSVCLFNISCVATLVTERTPTCCIPRLYVYTDVCMTNKNPTQTTWSCYVWDAISRLVGDSGSYRWNNNARYFSSYEKSLYNRIWVISWFYLRKSSNEYIRDTYTTIILILEMEMFNFCKPKRFLVYTSINSVPSYIPVLTNKMTYTVL